jgi:endonuclease/exonuclease/phosphatase family metal-dependent hydrolase
VTYFQEGAFRFEGKNNGRLEGTSYLSACGQESSQAPKTTSMLSVYILTWNINGAHPEQVDLSSLFSDLKGDRLPDILAFGLQEMVALNAKNVLVTGSQTEASSDSWRAAIKAELARRCGMEDDAYIVVEQGDLVGLFNLVLIHSRIKHRVTDIDVDIVKTGYGGKLGNKGAALIRFKIDSDRVTFVNCHLEAGDKKVEGRLQHIQDIHEKAFLNSKKRSTLLDSEYVFFYGDLNFRIAREDAKNVISALNTLVEAKIDDTERSKVARVIIASLKPFDQLLLHQHSDPLLSQYKEGEIWFLPTYKFEKGGLLYTARKERCPSWCDRILLRSLRGCYLRKGYHSKALPLSDHQPVSAEFAIEVANH